MKQKLITALFAASVLTACSSTGVVQTGGDTYMNAKTGAGMVAEMSADLYREAIAFCAGQNKKFEKIELTEQNNIPFVRRANSKLEFRCV